MQGTLFGSFRASSSLITAAWEFVRQFCSISSLLLTRTICSWAPWCKPRWYWLSLHIALLLISCVYCRELWFKVLRRCGWQHLAPSPQSPETRLWYFVHSGHLVFMAWTESSCFQRPSFCRSFYRIFTIWEAADLWSRPNFLDSAEKNSFFLRCVYSLPPPYLPLFFSFFLLVAYLYWLQLRERLLSPTG